MLTFTARMIAALVKGHIKGAPTPGTDLVSTWRCWPIDLDVFMHLNNANYLRVAELSRWSNMAELGFLSNPKAR